MSDGPPYAHAIVKRLPPSTVSPTNAVISPIGNVYEIPSTTTASAVVLFKPNSEREPAFEFPASNLVTNLSSPVKLVVSFIPKL